MTLAASGQELTGRTLDATKRLVDLELSQRNALLLSDLSAAFAGDFLLGVSAEGNSRVHFPEAESIGIQRPAALFRHEQILSEGPFLVDPLSVAAESGALRHLRNFFSFVLVRAFRPDGFVFV